VTTGEGTSITIANIQEGEGGISSKNGNVKVQLLKPRIYNIQMEMDLKLA
jgi:hypothetical protein